MKTLMNKITNDVIELIGNTPLIRLNKIADKEKGAEILGKLESFNPGGSVKDRPCLEMINSSNNKHIRLSERSLTNENGLTFNADSPSS